MRVETAAAWGGEYRFGFVANSGDRNEVGIDKKICVGYKGEFQCPKRERMLKGIELQNDPV